MNWQEEVNKRKEQIVETARAFLQIESVLDEATATESSPFGKGIDKALTFLLQRGKEFNLSTKNVDGYAGLIEYGHGEESVGVLCHIDVVPAQSNGWLTHPFAAEVRDQAIIARGAMDNKGPTIASFFALVLLKELGLEVNKRVQLILGTDEESHWRCVEHYFKQEEMPVIGFAPDADFPIIHAEKGIIDVMLSQSRQATNQPNSIIKLVRFTAGERMNMVPDEAVALLEGNLTHLEMIKEKYEHYLQNEGLDGMARLKQSQIELTCFGKAAHGSTPEVGVNAGVELASFLVHQGNLQDAISRFFSFVSTMRHDYTGKSFGIDMKDEVSGMLSVNAGLITYEEDGEAQLGCNIRYPVTKNGDVLINKLATLAQEHRLHCRIIDHMKPSYVEKDDPLIQTLQAVYERHTGEKAELLAIGGGTYARSLKKGVAFGPLFPGREDRAHQKNEEILIEDLLKMTAIYADAMYELAK
ncbi:acetylornithine deacetylase/succinyl-diaminopimelate desuccinylase and related deacylases [Halalkalibacter hemicellulosilyticusJCM 9152]|uniref:Acetylornithine deacetylase/succinyl-diaminopimelate desuccinylase and related deacylases n=1 Tax=Halalkalibacter hemicellulosilyticusJCM 9152 TaxID=1236971 RepID=W4QL52_9BACI|nr:acetylornithine deacetylase/succinyl-diaminopimelate desuccinylase and related deacylases [Halalkalibacter hemicellulosilyticusJCM 9152]